MKRTILINQQAVIEAGLDLDFVDLVIFDYIKDFSHSEKVMKVQCLDGVYFWIAHTKIMEDLPLLGIKTKAGIVKRIDRLVAAGILIKAKESAAVGKSLYRFGPNYDILVGTPLNENDTPYKKVEGEDKQNYRDSLNKNIGDNSISDNLNNAIIERVDTRDARIPRGTAEIKKCLFIDSRYYDFDKFSAEFAGDYYAGVDIRHYYEAVKNWSASNGEKKNDWIATARNWMQRDYQKGILVRQKPMTGLPGNLSEDDLYYLQMMHDDGELWGK